MGVYFRNSVIATLFSLLLIISFSAPVSFALTKMKWKLGEFTKRMGANLVPLSILK